MTIYRRFGTTNGQYLSTFRLHIKDDDENESPHEHPYPLRGCNSDIAQYSHTPILHHSAWPTIRTTRTRTKRLVRGASKQVSSLANRGNPLNNQQHRSGWWNG